MTDKPRTSVLLGGGLLLLMALPIIPQSRPAAPRGSYLQTCSQIRMEGSILSALCERPRSLPPRSSINVAMCAGDISNKDGNLFCFARPGTWGQGRAIPRGSYVDSCDSVFVVGTTLQARCRSRDGRYQKSLADLTKCRMGGDIWNIDGFLNCSK
jgi:CVNH domain